MKKNVFTDFGKVFTVVPDSQTKVKSSTYLKSGKYPVVDQGKGLVAGYTNTDPTVNDESLPVIIFGDHTRVVKYVDFPFTAGADGTQILKPSPSTHPKYGFYLVLHAVSQIPSKGYARHFGELRKIQFPLPSLEVQRKIVEKLDRAFLEIDLLDLNLNVSQGKMLELFASLLSESFTHVTFKQKAINPPANNIAGPFKTSTLGNVMEFQNGRAFKSTEWSEQGLPIIRIQNLNNRNSSYNHYDGLFDDRILINNGDLLFSWSGTVGTSFGPHIWRGPRALLNQHIFKVTLKSSIEKQYAYYALLSITALIENNVNGSVGLTHITKAKLVNFEIPLPSLREQQDIVERLDKASAEAELLASQLLKRQDLASKLRNSLLNSVFTEVSGVA
jgi:restriction endonuclease S subunit